MFAYADMFWKSVKILNKQNSSIPVQSKDSNVYSTDQEKADVLNSFFCKNFNYSISPITPQDSSYENDPQPNLLCTVEEVINKWLFLQSEPIAT